MEAVSENYEICQSEESIWDEASLSFLKPLEPFLTYYPAFNNSYALVVHTEKLLPLIAPETTLIVRPGEEYQSGDLVIACNDENRIAFGRIFYHDEYISPYIQLRAYSSSYEDTIIPKDRVQWCHKVVIILQP